MTSGAVMAFLRKPATKVVVFRWPYGACPMRRSPRVQRPRKRVIAVLVPVSSMKTSLSGSSVACSRFHSSRAAATSGRNCSRRAKAFFDADFARVEEPPERRDAGHNATFARVTKYLRERDIRPLGDQPQQPFGMINQRRTAMAPRQAWGERSGIRQRRTHLTADDGLTENISAEVRAEAPPSTSRITRSRKSFERAFVMASLRESDAEDSLNSALLGILLRRIRFSPNEKCSKLLKPGENECLRPQMTRLFSPPPPARCPGPCAEMTPTII